MESLDREFDRQQSGRLDPKRVLAPAQATTLAEIKILVSQLDPAKNQPQPTIIVGGRLTGVDLEGKSVPYEVSAETKSKSKRDTLLDGLNLIQKRMEMEEEVAQSDDVVEVNGHIMKPAIIGSGIHSHSWVDPLIKQWLGGFRDGIKICWKLNDGYRYEYDLYGHKLTRVRDDEADQS